MVEAAEHMMSRCDWRCRLKSVTEAGRRLVSGMTTRSLMSNTKVTFHFYSVQTFPHLLTRYVTHLNTCIHSRVDGPWDSWDKMPDYWTHEGRPVLVSGQESRHTDSL